MTRREQVIHAREQSNSRANISGLKKIVTITILKIYGNLSVKSQEQLSHKFHFGQKGSGAWKVPFLNAIMKISK